MPIETDDPAVGNALVRTFQTIAAQQGAIARDLTVHERDGQIWCSIGERFGEPGRVLALYPVELAPVVTGVRWESDPDRLTLGEPAPHQTAPQLDLLEAWIDLVNALDRMSHVRQVVPAHAVRSQPLRHHLAAAGYPGLRKPSTDETVRETVIQWHSGPMGKSPDGESIWRLLPIKSLVNHHPDGANQVTPAPGKLSLVTGVNSNDVQTYENYGDLDAMLCLMTFGYVDDSARVVHSVPVEVESTAVGRVVVRWRAPREGVGLRRRDVPILGPLGAVGSPADAGGEVLGGAGGPEASDGLEIRHLSFRPDNRGATVAFLSMAVQSRSGLAVEPARREAERILNDILTANADYYSALDRLVLEAGAGSDAEAPVLPLIAQTSLLQQQRMRQFWGQA